MPEERRTGENIRALFLYVLLIAIMHGPVVFSGRTLQPPLYQPSGVVDGWPYGYSGRVPVNSFNIDSATPAYYEWPVNRLAGNMYKNLELPLWNPHQGAGTPLLAQYSSRVFFPYQIIEDISPVWLWDFFLLGRALIAGFFTYLFLRLVGAGFTSAFFGGFLYMFSGSFTWFLNLEQYSNTAMMLPVFMWSLEWVLKSGLGPAIATAALSFGLVILAGQPETALYVLALGALWYFFRVFKDRKSVAALRRAKRFAVLTLAGLAVAAPLILPFLEFEKQAYHIHPAGGAVGTDKLPGITSLISVVTPTAHEYPQEPELLYSLPLANGKTPAGENFYYRAIPLNGVWDFIGGYTGIVPLYLGVAGVLAALFAWQKRFRAALLFFFLAGTAVLLKNIGVAPFVWIGRLPLFDRAWSLRWAGPVWIFCFAVSAALAFEIFTNVSEADNSAVGRSSKKRVLACLLAGFAAIASLYVFFIPFIYLKFSAGYRDFVATVAPSLAIGVALTAGFLLSAFAVCAGHVKKGSGILAVMVIAAVELWWAVPRGYGYNGISLKAVPLAFGVLAAFAVFWWQRRIAAVLLALFFVSFMATDRSAKSGIPDRFDSVSEAPYVGFIKGKEGYPRTIGTRGALFPNFASAVGLYDVRYVNALSIDCFNSYVRARLNNGWNEKTFSLWFTGLPQRLDPNAPYPEAVESEILSNLPHYSLLGVKYIVAPKDGKPSAFDGKLNQFKLVYDREVRIYENTNALPRVFVVTDVASAESCSSAQDMTDNPGFDAKASAVIEKPPPSWFTGQKTNTSVARITAYNANKVIIEAVSDAPALAVLTDSYYTGWKAYVDNKPAEIYRVDGLARGVFIEKGAHVIEFRYMPESFVAGAVIGITAVLACACLFFWPARPRD